MSPLLSAADGETVTEQERRNVVILATGDDLTITWSRYAPGESGPALHVHREHTDAFYVLEGELTFGVGAGGAERIRVSPGGFVAVPPNVVHTFLNASGRDARWLNMHAPDKGFAASLRGEAGFDSFDPPADGGLPADSAIVSGPGEGERLGAVLLKAALPALRVAEHDAPGTYDPEGAYFALGGGRVLELRAPHTVPP